MTMAEDIRICFLGDSFVNGTGDETALGWTGRLCADAHARGVPVTWYNLGVRRSTSRDILRRWEAECGLRLPEGCDGRIVLSCGVNDAAIENESLRVPVEESCANVREILQGARGYKRLLVGPPPVDDDEKNSRILALSRRYTQEAGALGVPFIDLFGVLAGDSAYRREIAGRDGNHPGSAGYAKIAGILLSSPDWWFRAR